MGNICCKDSSQQNLIVIEKVSLLFDSYFVIVQGIKQAQLFKTDSPQLHNFITKYLEEQQGIDQNSDFQLKCIDVVMQLQPLAFVDRKQIKKQELLAACLRYQNFCDAVPNQKISFYPTFQSYLKFLKLCRMNPTKIIVPTIEQQLIWQAHMQDHELYTTDMKNYLGSLLTRHDLIPQQSLKHYYLQSQKIRSEQKAAQKELVTDKKQINYEQIENIRYFSGALLTDYPKYQTSDDNIVVTQDAGLSTFWIPTPFLTQGIPNQLGKGVADNFEKNKSQSDHYNNDNDNDDGGDGGDEGDGGD